MMLLVTGGSASGKSAYAGRLAERMAAVEENSQKVILYVATLADQSPESQQRIERHENMRKGGYYKVAECFSLEALRGLTDKISGTIQRGLSGDPFDQHHQYHTVLFDSLDGFTADVFFGTDRAEPVLRQDAFRVPEVLVQMLSSLEPAEGVLIIVSDNIYEDGIRYDAITCKYMEYTASVMQLLAEKANCVIEVICGIPLLLKGENFEFLQISRDHDVSVYKDTGSVD